MENSEVTPLNLAEVKLLNTVSFLLYFVPIFLFLEVFMRMADVPGSISSGLNALTVGAIWYLIISKIVKLINDQMNAQREFEIRKYEEKLKKPSRKKKDDEDDD